MAGTFLDGSWEQRIQAGQFGSTQPLSTLTGRIISSTSATLVDFPVLTPNVNAAGGGTMTTSTSVATATGTPFQFQLMNGSTPVHSLDSSDITITNAGTPVTTVTSGRSYSLVITYNLETISPEYEQDNDWKNRNTTLFFGLAVPAVTMTSRLVENTNVLVTFTSVIVTPESTNQTKISTSTGTASATGTPTGLQFLEGSTVKGFIPIGNLSITDGDGNPVTQVQTGEQYAVSGAGIVAGHS